MSLTQSFSLDKKNVIWPDGEISVKIVLYLSNFPYIYLFRFPYECFLMHFLFHGSATEIRYNCCVKGTPMAIKIKLADTFLQIKIYFHILHHVMTHKFYVFRVCNFPTYILCQYGGQYDSQSGGKPFVL